MQTNIEQTNNIDIASDSTIETIVSESELDRSYWFVVRYGILTSHLKMCFEATSLKTFLPMQHKKRINRHTNAVEYVKVPVINGYLFVYATLNEALEFCEKCKLYLWRNNNNIDSRERTLDYYVRIKESAMLAFMKATEIKDSNICSFEAANIDLEKDDLVEFTKGKFKGERGYLKTTQGKKGGIVVIPLAFVGNENKKHDNINDKKYLHKTRHISYSIKAKADEIAVIEFAKKNRHAVNNILNARNIVKNIFESYANGEKITAAQRERMISYLQRYGKLQLNTNIMQANLLLLFYRICVILNFEFQANEVYDSIKATVIPAFKERINNARSINKQNAIKALEKYEAQLNQVNIVRKRSNKEQI